METLFQSYKPAIQAQGLYSCLPIESPDSFNYSLFWNTIQEIVSQKNIPLGCLLASIIEVSTVVTILAKANSNNAKEALVQVTEQNRIGALALSEKEWNGQLEKLSERGSAIFQQKHIVTNAPSSSFALTTVKEENGFPIYLVSRDLYDLIDISLTLPDILRGFEHSGLRIPVSELHAENRLDITYTMGKEIREKEIFGISAFLLGIALQNDRITPKQAEDWKKKQWENYNSSNFRRRMRLSQGTMDLYAMVEKSEHSELDPGVFRVFSFLRALIA